MLDLTDICQDEVKQGFDPANPKCGFYLDVPNDVYHSATKAISNSILGMCKDSVSAYQWVQKAPVDKSKLETFDFGSAVHSLTLEPNNFEKEFAVMPKFNLRTNKGKEEASAWRTQNADKYHLTTDEYFKACLMRDSLMADPRFYDYIAHPKGVAESVIVWRDEETGLLMRIRPDWLIELDEMVICVDLKTTESIAKFRREFFNLRYDVQDSMYREGIQKHFDKPVLFLFAAVSKTVELGRYPVTVDHINEDDRNIAYSIYRSDLNRVAKAIKTNDWLEYGELKRTQKQREYFYEQQSS